MRHISTLIAAVFVGPLSWVLLAYGQDRSIQAFANAKADGGFNTTDFVRPAACLIAAGLLLGLLATLRFSPLGVVVTGAGYATSYLALLLAPDGVLNLFPDSLTVAGRTADPTTPLRTGTALVLGALMLVAVASVGRWRNWPSPEEPEEPATTTPERADNRPLGAEGLVDPSTSAADHEPELVSRYSSRPRSSANRRSNSYGPADNSTDQWQQQRRQSAWPY